MTFTKRLITRSERQASTVAAIATRVAERWPKVEAVAAAMAQPTLRAAGSRDGGRSSDHADPTASIALGHPGYDDLVEAVYACLEQIKWIERRQVEYLREHPETAAAKTDDLKSLCVTPGCDFRAERRGLCWHHYRRELATGGEIPRVEGEIVLHAGEQVLHAADQQGCFVSLPVVVSRAVRGHDDDTEPAVLALDVARARAARLGRSDPRPSWLNAVARRLDPATITALATQGLDPAAIDLELDQATPPPTRPHPDDDAVRAQSALAARNLRRAIGQPQCSRCSDLGVIERPDGTCEPCTHDPGATA